MQVSRRVFLSSLASASLVPFVHSANADTVDGWETFYRSTCRRTEAGWKKVGEVEEQLLADGAYDLEDRYYLQRIHNSHHRRAMRHAYRLEQQKLEPELFKILEHVRHYEKKDKQSLYFIQCAKEKRAKWQEMCAASGLMERRQEARRLEAEEDEISTSLLAWSQDDPAYARLRSAIRRRRTYPALVVDHIGVIENENPSFEYVGSCELLGPLTLTDFPPSMFTRRLESIGFNFRDYYGFLPHHQLTTAEARQVARLYSCACRVEGMREAFDDYLGDRIDGNFFAS